MEIGNKVLCRAYEGSYYTIVGAGGVLQEWKDGYSSWLQREGIGQVKDWVQFTGKDMNSEFELTGDNRYPDELQFLAFPLDGLNVGKLAMFKIQMGDRWFDDIVDNLRREKR